MFNACIAVCDQGGYFETKPYSTADGRIDGLDLRQTHSVLCDGM